MRYWFGQRNLTMPVMHIGLPWQEMTMALHAICWRVCVCVFGRESPLGCAQGGVCPEHLGGEDEKPQFADVPIYPYAQYVTSSRSPVLLRCNLAELHKSA